MFDSGTQQGKATPYTGPAGIYRVNTFPESAGTLWVQIDPAITKDPQGVEKSIPILGNVHVTDKGFIYNKLQPSHAVRVYHMPKAWQNNRLTPDLQGMVKPMADYATTGIPLGMLPSTPQITTNSLGLLGQITGEPTTSTGADEGDIDRLIPPGMGRGSMVPSINDLVIVGIVLMIALAVFLGFRSGKGGTS